MGICQTGTDAYLIAMRQRSAERTAIYNRTWRTKHPTQSRLAVKRWVAANPNRYKVSRRESYEKAKLLSAKHTLKWRRRSRGIPLDIWPALKKIFLATEFCYYCQAPVSFIPAEVLAGKKRQAQIEHLNGRQKSSRIDDFAVACADCNSALRACRTEQEKWTRIAEAKAALAGLWKFTQFKLANENPAP